MWKVRSFGRQSEDRKMRCTECWGQGDGLPHPVSDAASGCRIQGPCFVEPETLLWLLSNGPAGFPYFLIVRVSRQPRMWLRAIDFFWLPGAHLLLPFHIVSLITLSAMMSTHANLSSVVCRKENLKKWVSRMTILLQISLHRSWSNSGPCQAWQDPASAMSQTWP